MRVEMSVRHVQNQAVEGFRQRLLSLCTLCRNYQQLSLAAVICCGLDRISLQLLRCIRW